MSSVASQPSSGITSLSTSSTISEAAAAAPKFFCS